MAESKKILRLSSGLSDYQPLLLADPSQHDLATDSDSDSELQRCRRNVRLARRAILALCALIAVLVISNVVLFREISRVRALAHRLDSQLLYSPAQEAVEYDIVKFHAGPLNNEEDDIYSSPPSPEVDQAWRDLYEIGAISLPLDVEPKLPNKTHKTNDGTGVILQIDVFHQLHCLNKLRKALHPDYYLPEDRRESPEIHRMHIAHCLNSIRQSLQCSSDISLVTFNLQSIEALHRKPKLLPTFNVVHTCRNFEKIKEWTRARWIGSYLDDE